MLLFVSLIANIYEILIVNAITITWELEDYNEWNLPFAKTV